MLETIGQILPIISIGWIRGKNYYKLILKVIKINWIVYIIGYVEGIEKEIKVGEWYKTGGNKVTYTYIIEEYTREIEILISTISIYVINYSYSYMSKELKIWYITRIIIFKMGMEIIIRSKESILIFVGWETIGWMSYMLVNYWSGRIESNKGSIEGIIMNKIGDISIVYNLSEMNSSLGWKNITGDVRVGTGYIIIGAMVKSAQWGGQSWLTKSMAGPTAISALIHSSTLVTAGVMLIYRTEEVRRNRGILKIVGSGTLVYSVWNSNNAQDIKKLIAWSTSNQMGVLIISISENRNMIDHVITHGISKSLWFLSVGKIITRQDIRRRGGERDRTSYVYRMIGSLNISGIGYSSGTITKESILMNVSSYMVIISIILSSIGTIEYTERSFRMNKGGYNKEEKGEEKNVEELIKETYIIEYSNSVSEIIWSSITTIIGVSIDRREVERDGYETIKREMIEKYQRGGSRIRKYISNGIEENIWIIRRYRRIKRPIKTIGGSWNSLIKGILIWM